MALDFSKFILPAPSADWLSKVPEYDALGRKTAAAEAKAKETDNFDKLLQSSVYGKPVTIKDPKAVISGEIKEQFATRIPLIVKKAKENKLLGKPDWDNLSDVKQEFASLNTDANNLSQLSNVFEQGIELPNKKHKGFNLENARKNFLDITQYTLDPSGNKIAAPIATVIQNANGNPTELAARVINPDLAPFDNWGDEDITEVLKNANPVKSKQTFINRNSAGVETGETIESTLPSSFYEFQTTETGEKVPVPKGQEITIADDKIANAYKEVLGDAVSGKTVNIVPDETFSALSNEGSINYLKQEQAKFRRAAAKNGIDVSTPEFAKELDNFSKAVMYKTVDNYLPQAGYSQSKGKVNKKPLPMSPSTQGKVTSNLKDRNATFATYTDKWTNTKDADGFIDIKDEVSGINDTKGRDYSKKAGVKLGKENGKWVIKVYKNDDDGNPVLDRTMTLSQFRADTKTGADGDDKRQAAHTFVEDWTKDLDTKSKPKSPKKSGKKKFD